jgi:myo-inositol-1-phosphate synthase
MTEKERELLVGLAKILQNEYVELDSHLQFDIGGMLDELEKEDRKQLELEEELSSIANEPIKEE